MDIFWWLERIGTLDRTIDEMSDPETARREPSLQLVGRPDHSDIDLATVQDLGVELTGRLVAADGHHVRFADDLARTVSVADGRLRQLLATIDDHIDASGLTAEVLDASPFRTVPLGHPVERLDLRAHGISTVLWATGHRRSYPWLTVPVLDAGGEIRHRRGVTPVPGLYVLGQRFQHRRRSSFLDGVGLDALDIAEHLTGGCPSLPDPATTRS